MIRRYAVKHGPDQSCMCNSSNLKQTVNSNLIIIVFNFCLFHHLITASSIAALCKVKKAKRKVACNVKQLLLVWYAPFTLL